jgi:hypothetical protein
MRIISRHEFWLVQIELMAVVRDLVRIAAVERKLLHIERGIEGTANEAILLVEPPEEPQIGLL